MRLLIVALLAALLLSLAGRRVPDGSAAASAPPPPQVRQKYVIRNILSNEASSATLTRLKSQFLDAIKEKYSDLDVDVESRDWLDPKTCKEGQNCDLITIDLDRRQLLIRCTASQVALSVPVPPAPCPNSKDRCMLPLPRQLPQKLWLHDEVHRNKNR